MLVPAPDRSRDRRIEDPTNLLIVHPAAYRLLPFALHHRISANAVSVAGLIAGVGAAACYYQGDDSRLATLGFLLSIAWLIADGLDGMVARATGTTSALGRMLDGLCDHGVFILIYVALAAAIGTAAGWYLAFGAGFAHALQSNLYEAERARFHRRLRGSFVIESIPSRFALLRLYGAVAGGIDRLADPFDRAMSRAGHSGLPTTAVGSRYATEAVPSMRLMSLLSANVRVLAIYIACLCDNSKYFWWFEIVPLSIVAVIAITGHRRVEARLAKTAMLRRTRWLEVGTVDGHDVENER